MKTITTESKSDYRISGSKFFGFLFPAADTDTADERLRNLRKEYYDANHHCLAYRIGIEDLQEFSSDDGEPSGTAGLPILNALRSAELVNCALIVVRIFGGTKLGKAGLIDAYGKAAIEAIELNQLKNIKRVQWIELVYSYDQQNLIEIMKHRFDVHIAEEEYLEKVRIKLAIGLDDSAKLTHYLENLTHEGISFDTQEQGFIFVD